MEEIQVNLAYRWFLGYDLDEATPDHSVLSKARVRFGMEVFEAFFNRTVEICREAGLVHGEAAFVDSTLIQANAALASLEPSIATRPPMSPKRYVKRLFEENPVQDQAPPSVPTAGPPTEEPERVEERPATAKRPALNRRARSRTDPEASIIHHPTFGLHLAYKARGRPDFRVLEQTRIDPEAKKLKAIETAVGDRLVREVTHLLRPDGTGERKRAPRRCGGRPPVPLKQQERLWHLRHHSLPRWSIEALATEFLGDNYATPRATISTRLARFKKAHPELTSEDDCSWCAKGYAPNPPINC